ncbi:IS1380 family transposase [uncultured Dubosiella sp.]|uniref:IS1380 family transposase n=1 Tax=uncultured Dubosiella sp. TaxID=1937011 RepID=UPI0027300DF3|nr:IS1380 family transposase [uncultured Dubosiella sp.]
MTTIIFSGGNITSDAGAILFSSFLGASRLFDSFALLPFQDERKDPVHTCHDILAQLVFKVLLGYFNQSDQSVLDRDPLFDFDAASQSTVSRFFQHALPSLNNAFHELLQKTAMDHLDRVDHDLILDADSTCIETSGKQEGVAYIPHYKTTGLHPLLINEYYSKLLVASSLRYGNTYSSNGTIELLDQVFAHLEPAFSRTILFRGDSAFYSTKLMDYLEDLPCPVHYFIRCKHFGKLVQACQDDMMDKGIEFTAYSQTNPYYGELSYPFGNKTRRVVYKAYQTMDKDGQLSLIPEIYAIMTDVDWTPRNTMRFYEQRGNSENYTKELKDDFGAGKLSQKTFMANELNFLIKGFAYNVYHLFLHKAVRKMRVVFIMRMNTFRKAFIKVGGKVIKHARRKTLCMSSAYPRQEQFDQLYKNIQFE